MAEWVIEIRLGQRPGAQPVRRCVVEATSEAAALRQVLALAEGEEAGHTADLLHAGQEEVFSRSEVREGRIEHHAGEEAPPEAEGEPMDRPSVERS